MHIAAKERRERPSTMACADIFHARRKNVIVFLEVLINQCRSMARSRKIPARNTCILRARFYYFTRVVKRTTGRTACSCMGPRRRIRFELFSTKFAAQKETTFEIRNGFT